MRPIKFPKDFLFGSATAGLQVDGSDEHSNWYHWSLAGKIKDNESPITAADHYNRYPEDISLMQEMNHQVYRLSIEWSRIEPKKGQWSQEAMKHYRHKFSLLKKAGIKPLVTLYHFSHPQWFEEEGQWLSDKAVYYFIRFVNVFLQACGDVISEYCTINEPNVLAMSSFIDGDFPPGKSNDVKSYLIASRHLIQAHQKAYTLIHRFRKKAGFSDTLVGFAMHVTYLEAHQGSKRAKFSLKAMNYLFHDIFFRAMIEGKRVSLIGLLKNNSSSSFADYLGINYYTRHMVYPSNNPAMLFGEPKARTNLSPLDQNDLGWEIYPEGLYHILKPLYRKYQLPIFITENGLADADDSRRSLFIYHHLYQVHRLIQEGIDIERYYHWSTMDNLEWHDGYAPRFGLIEIDYETQKRTIRESGRFLSEVSQKKAITVEMIQTYLTKEE